MPFNNAINTITTSGLRRRRAALTGAALLSLALAGGCGFAVAPVDSAGAKASAAVGDWELDIAALGGGLKEQVADDLMEWKPLSSADWKDLFRTQVLLSPELPPRTVGVHLFGDDRWIPYSDKGLITTTQSGVTFSDGTADSGIAGDVALVEALCQGQEGQIGISLKQVAPEYRVLNPTEADKEAMKLYDTHIQLWTCVKDETGALRLFTLNNPTSYAKQAQTLQGPAHGQNKVYGNIGTQTYGNIFFKPNYDALGANKQLVLSDGRTLAAAFHDNLRTMATLFNSISWFPAGNYNGNDPLAGYSPKTVRKLLAMAIHAVIGTTGAREWWNKTENLVYCAELSHLAASAALLVPLNADNVVGLEATGGFPAIGEAEWQAFGDEIAKHEAFRAAAADRAITQDELCSGAQVPWFDKRNRANTGYADRGECAGAKWGQFRAGSISRIPLATSPAEMKTFAAYVDPALWPAGKDCLDPNLDEPACLAFKPLNMADMVRYFLANYFPRKDARSIEEEAMYGQIQAQVLTQMKPGLIEAANLAVLDDDPPAVAQAKQAGQVALGAIVDEIIPVVAQPYGSYEAFSSALVQSAGWAKAQGFVTQGSRETAYFSPPSLFHLVAKGQHRHEEIDVDRLQSFMGLDYIAHGIHFSLVKAKAASTNAGPSPSAPTSEITLGPGYEGDACRASDGNIYTCVDVNKAGPCQVDAAGDDYTRNYGVNTERFKCPKGTSAIVCCKSQPFVP